MKKILSILLLWFLFAIPAFAAFPTNTTILDAFDRTDAPTMTGWIDPFGGIYGAWGCDGSNNCVQSSFAIGYTLTFYGTSYNSPCEFFVTVVTKPANGQVLFVGGYKGYGSAGDLDGYAIRLIPGAGNDTFELIRATNGAIDATLDTRSDLEFANSEKLGWFVDYDNSTVKGYRYTGGSWVEILSYTGANVTHDGPFYPVLISDDSGQNVVLDDFGGGEYIPPAGAFFPLINGGPTEQRSLAQ